MKNTLKKMVALALTFGLAGSAWAGGGGGSYLEPVYKTAGEPTSGIAYWAANSIDDIDYDIRHYVTGSNGAVTWGESNKTNWYVLSSGQPLTIKGGVTCKGDVRLILCDNSKLTISNVADDCAGIQTDGSGSFTIYGDSDGVAELVVTGGVNGAGIGGGDSKDGKNITINGGVVTATGGEGGAGIGGGQGGYGQNIVINGGTVTATGDAGAGIGGGGTNGDGSNITINGGTVTATGDEGAGIGGSGAGGEGYNITINGGKVKAKAGGSCENAIGDGTPDSPL